MGGGLPGAAAAGVAVTAVVGALALIPRRVSFLRAPTPVSRAVVAIRASSCAVNAPLCYVWFGLCPQFRVVSSMRSLDPPGLGVPSQGESGVHDGGVGGAACAAAPKKGKF